MVKFSRFSISLLLAAISLQFALCARFCVVPAGAGPQATAAKSVAPEHPNWQRLRKETDSWKVLKDPQVRKLIGLTAGAKSDRYWDCTQLAADPKVVGDDLFVSAGVRGLFSVMESAFDLNLVSGKCYVGYLNDQVIHIYGAAAEKDLPKPVHDYLKDLKERNHEVRVVFEKTEAAPVKAAGAKLAKPNGQPKKKLNYTTITGTYSRDDSSRFESASIKVIALPGGKVKFGVEASNGGHSGEAAGAVPLVNKEAVLEESGSKLKLHFTGSTVDVSGDDQYWCGMGVTLSGKYYKISDDVPKLDP